MMFEVSIQNSYPLGHLLLHKDNPFYSQRIDTLNKIQDIFDDFTLDKNHQIQIPNTLAIIYLRQDNLQNAKDNPNNPKIPQDVQLFAKKAQETFEISLWEIDSIDFVDGHLGNFTLHSQEKKINFAQAVLFVEEENLARFRGFYRVADFLNPQLLLDTLQSNLGIYEYSEAISYNSNLCQFHHRREKHCTKCVSVCPTFGVGANETLMELVFSPIDCIACGACVGVCPTNCLEYEIFPKDALEEIYPLLSQNFIFLCDKEGYEELVKNQVTLPFNLFPLVLPTLKFLNENDFLTFLQASSRDLLVFYKRTLENLDFVNNITAACYHKKAIKQAYHFSEIESLSASLGEFESYLYKNRYNKSHRESFAQRVRFILKDKDYGLAKSVEPIFYGNIAIDESRCTLCLSCVGACNVNALFAKEEDFSLRYNPSLCTTCGYCIASCPENIMELSKEGMLLREDYFQSRKLAQDEPFRCVECGKVFATKKSIDKITQMLQNTFMQESDKLRTLQCCADCKVKVMFQNNLGIQRNSNV